MKTKNICVAIAAYLSIAPISAAHAQSYGQNVPPPTPQELATFKGFHSLRKQTEKEIDARDYAAAEADARKAMTMGWLGTSSRDLLAVTLDAEGKETEALQEYKTIANEGTNDPRVLLPYALLLLKSGQYAQAANAYNKALPLLSCGGLMRADGEFSRDVPQPKDLETACHIALGLEYYVYGMVGANRRDDLALDQYQRALQLTPDSVLATLYSGYSLHDLKLEPQAKAAFAKAVALGDGEAKQQATDALNGRRFSP